MPPALSLEMLPVPITPLALADLPIISSAPVNSICLPCVISLCRRSPSLLSMLTTYDEALQGRGRNKTKNNNNKCQHVKKNNIIVVVKIFIDASYFPF